MPTTCPRTPASAVRVSLLGDFPPVQVSFDVVPSGVQQSLPRGEARSISVEGLSATAVTALGWSGPLPDAQPGQQQVVPLLYGSPDSLCPVWGLRQPRAFHQAALLSGGRVVVTGGIDPAGPADTLEIYRTDEPDVARPLPLYAGSALGHSTTALPDGTFLVAGGGHPGGDASQAARIYDADGNQESGLLLLSGGPRALHGAMLLPGGQQGEQEKIWLSGGCRHLAPRAPGQPPSCAAGDVLDTSVLYAPQGDSQPGPRLFQPRYGHQVFVLGDGRMLLVGGMTVTAKQVVPALQAELIDPLDATGRGSLVGRAGTGAGLLPAGGLLWAAHDDTDAVDAGLLLPGEVSLPLVPLFPRSQASLTVLPDGAALLSGGRDPNGDVVPPVELYQAGAFHALPGALPRVGHAAVLLPDATVLLLGGELADGSLTPLVSRFVHSLRLADATPPPWPLPPADGVLWLAPRRPDRIQFDGATLVVQAPASGPGGRPGELALISGVMLGTGTLRLGVLLPPASMGDSGAALVIGHHSDGDYYFVRLSPGRAVALLQVKGQDTQPVPGCQGMVLPAPAPGAALQLQVQLTELGQGQDVSFSIGGAEALHCQVTSLTRGAVGMGSLGGPAQFQDFSLTRGP